MLALDTQQYEEMVVTRGSSAGSSSPLDYPPRQRLEPVEMAAQLDIVPGPAIVMLLQLPTTGRKLSSFIYLTVDHDESGDVVVSDSVMHLYGIGGTLEEAIEDYEAMLLEDYETLSENAGRLSPGLQRQLHYLNSLLV